MVRWFRRRPSWQELHPLPAGWRPRTRIDTRGREVEPWGYLIADVHTEAIDGGEWWLPVGYDPDQAAYEILTRWLERSAPGLLAPWEVPGVRCAARPNAYPGDRVGVAYAAEQVLTAGGGHG